MALLNTMQSAVTSRFTLGDSRDTLAGFECDTVDLAWIDGGHDYSIARSDLDHAMRFRARWIAVDDAKAMPQVASAVDEALAAHSDYEKIVD